MLVVHIATILLFAALGLVFIQGKGAMLIAGYNTSSKKEKEKYNQKALCKFMGKVMFSLAGCFCLAAVGDLIKSQIPIRICWVGFTVIIIFTVIYVNTGNRFKK